MIPKNQIKSKPWRLIGAWTICPGCFPLSPFFDKWALFPFWRVALLPPPPPPLPPASLYSCLPFFLSSLRFAQALFILEKKRRCVALQNGTMTKIYSEPSRFSSRHGNNTFCLIKHLFYIYILCLNVFFSLIVSLRFISHSNHQ